MKYRTFRLGIQEALTVTAHKEYVDFPANNVHASNLCLFQGRLYLACFGGEHEDADDVDIFVTRRDEDGWMAPVRISAGADRPHWNPVMRAREDHIDLFFKFDRPIPRWKSMRAALDGGLRLISPLREVVPGDEGGRGPVKNKCLTLRSGRVLAPASLEEGTWRPFVDVSDDDGETFTALRPIPLLRAGDTAPDDGYPYCFAARQGAIQPTLWQTDDGAVHALMRSSEGFILRSDSYDQGETWRPAYLTGLPNNNSGIDLARMPSGLVVLAYNPVSADWGARTPLRLDISRDGGDTFEPLMTLEDQKGEYSYPCVIAEGSRLYVSYTYDRKKIAVWTIDGIA